jgi:hypothetical protein
MTDETYKRIREFVEHWAIPPDPILFPKGMGVEVVIDADVPVDAPVLAEEPYVSLRLHPDDYLDLKRRVEQEAT